MLSTVVSLLSVQTFTSSPLVKRAVAVLSEDLSWGLGSQVKQLTIAFNSSSVRSGDLSG